MNQTSKTWVIAAILVIVLGGVSFYFVRSTTPQAVTQTSQDTKASDQSDKMSTEPEQSMTPNDVSTQTPNPATPTPDTTKTTPADTTTPTGEKSYTMAEVQAANSGDKCWTTIAGNVYDLTSFTGKHPGGSVKIMSICGKDGTSAFEGQHDGQRKPEQELASLKIGVLKK